jgi:predicted nucleotidyltransferase/uncharacterized protein (UPF0332 family)
MLSGGQMIDDIEKFIKEQEKEWVETPYQKRRKKATKLDKKRIKRMEELRKKKMKLAEKFKDEVIKKYSKIVKAVVIFGSFTRGDFREKSDVDMLVIYDDTAARLTPEGKLRFDNDLRKIAKEISPDVSVQPAWSLTEFWDMARIGHPLLYTIVRDGWALYDSGFFIPVRKLLEAGKIPATLEAVEKFMNSVPLKIKRVEAAKLFMIAEDLYYAMLNATQAIIMFLGRIPPTPKYTPKAVEEYLISTKLLEKEYLDDLKEIIEFRKGVEHKEIKSVSGQKLDELIEKTKKYVSRMEQLLLQLEKKKKEDIIMRNYDVMIKASVAALKEMNKLPADPKNLPKAIRKELIDTGKISTFYVDIFKRVVLMRKMLEDDKINQIPQKDIELMREYVRRFVRDLAPLIGRARTKAKRTVSQKKRKTTKKK